MTNLIFDLNNIMHRSMFVVGGYGTKQFSFDSQSEIDQLMRKVAMDVAYIIRIVNPSRILFAKDNKSWRKQIKIEENEGYKGQRIYSKHINWTNVYKAIDDFCEIMENYGLVVTQIPNSEADDIICMWSHELQLNQNQHVIIVSGDEDMRQLVSAYPYDAPNKKFAFITVFNPFMQGKNASRKLFVPKYFEEWINTLGFVDIMHLRASIDVDKEDFQKIITSERTKMEVIDGRMIAMRKIFCGDDGDNVPAIYSWLTGKKTKDGEDEIARVTNSKFEKIYESLLLSPTELMDHYDLLDRSYKVKEAIIKYTKQTPLFDMVERIKRQIKLVVLDEHGFPEEIVDEFNKTKIEQLQKPRVNYSNINMQNLLEGTRYVHERKNENVASIFTEIDRIKPNALF
jgi:5'-3' exonuclease